LFPVTQVLDEGSASNLPPGALYQPGTPRPSIVALFSSCLQIVQIVIPPIILLPSFGHGMRLATLARTPITAQGGAAMTDRSYEIPQDADLRNLARLVSACTLGLWAFAAGLLIGVFLFS
jgi:hypothetical protein